MTSTPPRMGAWAGLGRRRVESGSTAWYFLRDKTGVASLAVVVLIILSALFAPFLTHYAAQGNGTPAPAHEFLAPSLNHLLGTDELGRDELARVLFGARTSLILGFVVVTFGAVVGALVGAVAGFAGGWLDEALMRITDMVLSFPPLLLAIAVGAALGPSLQNEIVAIAVTWWPWYARLVRAEAISVRERHYVLAARSLGASTWWIIARHILPNVLSPVRVQVTLDLGAAILTGAALSFLGLGPQPPAADLGVMVSNGAQFLITGIWWLTIFPGLAIYVLVFAFNLLGDAFHTASDPRARS